MLREWQRDHPIQAMKFWMRCQRWYPERDRVAMWVANHLPRRVAYWAFIRMAVHGNNSYPGDQKCHEVLKRNGSWAS